METARSSLRPVVSGTSIVTAWDSSVLSLPDMRGPGTALKLALPCGGLNHDPKQLTLVSVGMNICRAPSGYVEGQVHHSIPLASSVAGNPWKSLSIAICIYVPCHRDLVYMNVCT